ncbi:hypothetical protein AVJ23_13145 [Pseudoponticoccus marisrubri]|uniref:Uncharacterized protein n=2 Tax=Pseudoponticoccus marisrubri TaxID=1685382 RepID=A0A0W7WIT5_9RHOB|nr:hypothetical protein AVJ23_13145 [Pseudoponticoccus marisrubri]
MRPVLIPLALAGLVSACTQFPELDAATSSAVAEAPYPQLVPLEGLLAGSEPRATPEIRAQVQGRVGQLRARADGLRAARVAPQSGIAARLARLRQKAAALRAQ